MKNLEVWRLSMALAAIAAQEAAALRSGQPSPFGSVPGVFAVMSSYNMKALSPHMETLQAALDGPFRAVTDPYDVEERELIAKHAGLPSGSHVVPSVNYDVPDRAAFTAELEALQAKYPGLQDAMEARSAAHKILEQDAPPISLQRIRPNQLPTQLSMELGAALSPMVEFPAVEGSAA